MEVQNLISLNELAKKLKVNKSHLNYYAWLKIIKPVMTAGKTMLFDKKYVIERLKIVKDYKKQGKSLKEIQKMLK